MHILLVRGVLARIESMLPEVKAVVGGKEHEGPVEHAGALQGAEQRLDHFIDRQHRLRARAIDTVELSNLERTKRRSLQEERLVAHVLLVEGSGTRDTESLEGSGVASGRYEWSVRRHRGEIEEKRSRGRGLASDEVDRRSREHVAQIVLGRCGVRDELAVDIQCG